MSAPLRDDDQFARAELETESVEAERRYAVERWERLHDHAPAPLVPNLEGGTTMVPGEIPGQAANGPHETAVSPSSIFAPAARTPQAPLGEADDSGLDIPSSGLPARVSPVRARVTSLLRRIFAPGSPSRSRHPLGADGGAGGRRSRANAGPATTSKPLTD